MTHLKVINWDNLNSHQNIYWYPVEKNTYKNMKTALRFMVDKNPLTLLNTTHQLTKFARKKMFSKWLV